MKLVLEESIGKIRSAETRADARIADAKAEAADILQQARQDGAARRAALEAKAAKAARDAMDAAKLDGIKAKAAAEAEIAAEVDALRSAALQKEPAITEQVIAQLL
ncbi:MAG: hypothetical protein VB055_10210 [Oscillospiraceae bacterium]|nr:hypothetical protein [Oscillospiraceae bacterium]